MGRIGIYGKLEIEERNGILTAKFRNSMKYGKLNNEILDVKEVENGKEVSGSLTEQQIIRQGYKPVCEVEKPSDAEFCVYKEYGVCFVQIWKRADEEVQEDEIWTAESGVMPKYSFYPIWSADSVQVKKGERYQCDDLLWEVVQAHTTQENWKPSLATASLWKVVEVEHEGTKEHPIPYTPPMQIYSGKYYTQNDVLYKCTRDSGIALSHDLSALIGTYVEVA